MVERAQSVALLDCFSGLEDARQAGKVLFPLGEIMLVVLCGVLRACADYYNRTRTHLSLNKDTPLARPMLRAGRIKSIPHLGGLHHSYVRM